MNHCNNKSIGANGKIFNLVAIRKLIDYPIVWKNRGNKFLLGAEIKNDNIWDDIKKAR